jgi:integrase
MTIAEVCDHFVQRELTKDNSWRSYSTKKAYKAYLNRWVIPHWGSVRQSEVRTTEVELWLRSLPLANSSCAKIRSILSVLFNHACRHELFDRNPIRLVRQGAKRRTTPSVLTPAEIKALIHALGLRDRTLVLLAASTGLRQSELFGLKWEDIDFAQGTMSVTHSIVYGVVGPCKTESSQKPVPVHPTVLEDSTDEWIDDVHTGLREINAVSGSDRQTVDNRGRCDEAILDRHGFSGFSKARQQFRPF